MSRKLSNEFYTRLNIWNGIIHRLQRVESDDARRIAENGWTFVWRDGEDVYLPEEPDDDSQPDLPFDIGGSYL